LREADSCWRKALALRADGGSRGAANVQTQLAGIALRERAYKESGAPADEALAAYREVAMTWVGPVPLVFLGLAAVAGRYAGAAALMRQGLESSSRLQDAAARPGSNSSCGGSRESREIGAAGNAPGGSEAMGDAIDRCRWDA